MASEDITYCINEKCRVLSCRRNPNNIKLPIPHSFADLEGTEDCPDWKEEEHGNQSN